jgi:hypothetical protein
MYLTPRLLLILAFAFFALPQSRGAFSATPLPEITSQKEVADWQDLVFAIESSTLSRGSRVLVAKGLHKGAIVGFSAKFDQDWKQEGKGKIPLAFGAITFGSTGPESDAFIRALAELYDAKLKTRTMKKEVTFDAVLLGEKLGDIERMRVSPKLFVQSKQESDYGELYFHIDIPKGEVMLKEKDPGYREQVLNAFAN